MNDFEEGHKSTRSQLYILQSTVDETLGGSSNLKVKTKGGHTSSKYQQPQSPQEKVISFKESAYNIFMTSWLNLAFLAFPISIASYALHWSDLVTFVFSLIALAPAAERLGYITEQLALHTNETIGGLLNATFGNLTELIVSIAALQKGLFRLVQLSLLGSVLSNMLLVLGTAFFCGGLKNPIQNYNKISSQVNSTLLIVSTMAIMYPTILYQTGKCSKLGELGLSRTAAITLFIIYLSFLYFQLYTHKHIYDESPELHKQEEDLLMNGGASEKSMIQRSKGDLKIVPYESSKDAGMPRVNTNQTNNTHLSHQSNESKSEEGLMKENETHSGKPDNKGGSEEGDEVNKGGDNGDEEAEEDELGYYNALFWLAFITGIIAFLSEAISDSIESAAKSAGVSAVFLSAIILPIVGNAAEHAGAIMFAMKGKVDLTLGVAIGSSTQIALCVLPLLVILGWMMGLDLDLNFGPYESATVLLTVIGVTFAIKDGESNWLLGLTLLGAYVIISAGFIAHDNDNLQ